MSRVSYPPSLAASDEPSKTPDGRFFVPSAGGGGGGFDIDSVYGVSDQGDFLQAGVNWYTDSGVTPATTAGDLIYDWRGGRSSGTAWVFSNATSSSRPELAIDGTYGLVAKYISGASKLNIHTIGTNEKLRLYGARVRNSVGTGYNTSRGVSLMARDTGGFDDGLGVVYDSAVTDHAPAYSNGTTYRSGVSIEDDQWHTLVAAVEPLTASTGTLRIYVDDMNTPSLETTISTTNTQNRAMLGSDSFHGADVYIYKSMAHVSWDAATPAELATWLEA